MLNLLDEFEWENHTREAVNRTLFLACKMIMLHWKSETPPTVKVWVVAVGNTMRMEKRIYQHMGCSRKYEKLWDLWLPDLAPADLTMDKLLGLNVG